jgi:fumarate reductase subunit D
VSGADYAFWLGFGVGGMFGAIAMTIVVLVVVRRWK